MRKIITSTTAALLLGLAVSSHSLAQDASRMFSAESGALAVAAKSDQAANAHKDAIKKLKKALKLKNLKPYEVSAMEQMLAVSYYATGKEEKAIESYEDAIAAGGLRADEVQKIQIAMAQLNIAAKNYDLAAQQLETFFAQGGVQNSKNLKLVLLAYMRDKNYEGAAPWAEKMLDRGFATTRPEYNNFLFLFNSPEKRAVQIRTADRMLQLWPNDAELRTKVDALKRTAAYEASTAG